MAAKSSLIPILRRLALKYACGRTQPAPLYIQSRLISAYAGQLQSLHNVLPRMSGVGIFQSRNKAGESRGYAGSRKPVSDEDDKDGDEDEEEDEELDEEDLDTDDEEMTDEEGLPYELSDDN